MWAPSDVEVHMGMTKPPSVKLFKQSELLARESFCIFKFSSYL